MKLSGLIHSLRPLPAIRSPSSSAPELGRKNTVGAHCVPTSRKPRHAMRMPYAMGQHKDQRASLQREMLSQRPTAEGSKPQRYRTIFNGWNFEKKPGGSRIIQHRNFSFGLCLTSKSTIKWIGWIGDQKHYARPPVGNQMWQSRALSWCSWGSLRATTYSKATW